MIKQITLMGKIRLQKEAEKIKNILKDQSGMSVIELLLILVGNFTPYLGCVLCGQSGNVWTNLTRYTEKGGKCV